MTDRYHSTMHKVYDSHTGYEYQCESHKQANDLALKLNAWHIGRVAPVEGPADAIGDEFNPNTDCGGSTTDPEFDLD